MIPKMFAFDLDGTLLDSTKKLSAQNKRALFEMASSGAQIVFASGRIGSSMIQFIQDLSINVALLTLNGAAVFMDKSYDFKPVLDVPLSADFADELIRYSAGKNFAVNYYLDGKLYVAKNPGVSKWIDLYFQQTSSIYNFVGSLNQFTGKTPSKMIFIGEKKELDDQEMYFRSLWENYVYICRTWDYYLEFLNVNVNKGKGLQVLADAYNVNLNDVVAFGDAANDIPMLSMAGLGIAVKNADFHAQKAAKKISCWTNDEDAIAKEWDLIKNCF